MGLRDLLAYSGGLGAKYGKWCRDIDPSTNSFLLLGVFTSVPILVKMDQEMRPWECPQTDRHTVRRKPIL